jgi:hydroxysqualene dehydroxylase
MNSTRRIAVIGGGWSGLAAAVHATRQGYSVKLFEMASVLGGRARTINKQGLALDNGQHILIGAYRETLALMQTVGVDLDASLLRIPLRLIGPGGRGLKMRSGHPVISFSMAVLKHSEWRFRERCALLWHAGLWVRNRFCCDSLLTVAELTATLPKPVRKQLIDPLCIAALNTPAERASGQVFLNVLQDSLLGPGGSADFLLPRQQLSKLLPEPAAVWLRSAGASLALSHRVKQLGFDSGMWSVDGDVFDGVVLACSAREAARLLEPHAPAWAKATRQLQHEAIMTVYAQSSGSRLPEAIMALPSDDSAPAQFVFDLGQLYGLDGVMAFVISGASPWVKLGNVAAVTATLKQGQAMLQPYLKIHLTEIKTVTEKRATFVCTPNLKRPIPHVLPGLGVAGDYIDGPYPASLEGAVRSGFAAADWATLACQ